MLETKEMHPGGYYLLKSLSCGRNCYFETAEEARIFKVLLKRYLGKIIEIHKLYLSSEGYDILVRIRSKAILIREYENRVKRGGKEIDCRFIEEPWRIVSEQIRVFHSTYVRMVNKMRDRKGVLVQRRYSRYVFSSEEEYEGYRVYMDEGGEVKSQKNKRYEVSECWKRRINWEVLRGVEFLESALSRALQNHVVSKLLNKTLKAHFFTP